MTGIPPLEKLARELFWTDLRRPRNGKTKSRAWRDLPDSARARWVTAATALVIQVYFLGIDFVNMAHGLGPEIAKREIARLNAGCVAAEGSA